MDRQFSTDNGPGAGTERHEIPITSVITVEGTYPRLEVDTKRVNMFKELFLSAPHKIPPIRVIPLADREGRYILIDGKHRLLGRQHLSDSIQAVLSLDPTLTSQNIGTLEIKRQIRLMAFLCNSKHGLLFSRKDIRNNIIELYSMGTSPKDLCLLAPERTVRHYLKDIRAHERKERERIKEVILKMRAEGCTQKEAAARLGITQGTVSKIEQRIKGEKPDENIPEGMSGNPADAIKAKAESFHPASLPQGICKPPCYLKADSTGMADEISSGTATPIERVYELIRKMKVTGKSQQYVKCYLIPLLAEKFPVVNELIKGTGYAMENELLMSDKQRLIKHIAHIEKKHSDLARSEEALRSELNTRKHFCKRQCRFSREQYMKEQKYFLDSLLEDIETQAPYIRILGRIDKDLVNQLGIGPLTALLEAFRDFVNQRKGILNTSEPDFDDLVKAARRQGSPTYAAKNGRAAGERDLIVQILEISKNSLTAGVSNTAYKFLSTFDYCLQLRHAQEDLRMRLTRFENILRQAAFSSDDLEERIREYRNALESYPAEDVNGRVN